MPDSFFSYSRFSALAAFGHHFLLDSATIGMTSEPPNKKRRMDQDEEMYRLDDEADDYVPYVPVKQQRTRRLQMLASTRGARLDPDKAPEKEVVEQKVDEEIEEERRKERARLDRTLLLEAQQVQAKKALEDASKTQEKKTEEEESEILAAIASRRKLASDLELAKGIQYTESLKTS